MATFNEVLNAFRSAEGQDFIEENYLNEGQPASLARTRMTQDLKDYLELKGIDVHQNYSAKEMADIIAEASFEGAKGTLTNAPISRMLRDVLVEGKLNPSLAVVSGEDVSNERRRLAKENAYEKERANAPPPPETKVSSSDLANDLRSMSEQARGPDKEALQELAERVERLGQDGFTKSQVKSLLDEAKLSDAARYVLDGRQQEIFSVLNLRREFPSQSAYRFDRAYESFKPSSLGSMIESLKDRIGSALGAAADRIPGLPSISSTFNRISGAVGNALSNNTLTTGIVAAVSGTATYAMTGNGMQSLNAAASTIAPETAAAVANGGGAGAIAQGVVVDGVNTGLSTVAGITAAGVATAVVGGVVAPVAAAVIAGAGVGYLVGQALAFEGAEPLDRQKMQALYSALPSANEQTSPEVYSLAVYKDAIEEAKQKPLADAARQEQRLKLLEDRFQDQYMALREGGQLEQVEQDVAGMAPPAAQAPAVPAVTQAAPAPAAPAAPSAPVQEATGPAAPDLNQQVAALAAAAGVPYPASRPKPSALSPG